MNTFDEIWEKTMKEYITKMVETTWVVCRMVKKCDIETKRNFLKTVKKKIGWEDETENQDRE